MFGIEFGVTEASEAIAGKLVNLISTLFGSDTKRRDEKNITSTLSKYPSIAGTMKETKLWVLLTSKNRAELTGTDDAGGVLLHLRQWKWSL